MHSEKEIFERRGRPLPGKINDTRSIMSRIERKKLGPSGWLAPEFLPSSFLWTTKQKKAIPKSGRGHLGKQNAPN